MSLACDVIALGSNQVEVEGGTKDHFRHVKVWGTSPY
jgi:hypothetical protein